MKKSIISLLIVFFTISSMPSCNSSTSSSGPDKCVLQYYERIIKNDPKCVDLMAMRYVGGTEKERTKMNTQLDEKIKKNEGNLSNLFFPYNSKLKSVELVPNEKGVAYTKTKSRILPEAEAAEVTVNLTFADGETTKETNIAVKIDGAWKIY